MNAMDVSMDDVPEGLPVEIRADIARRKVREALAAINQRLAVDRDLQGETRAVLVQCLEVLVQADEAVVAYLEQEPASE